MPSPRRARPTSTASRRVDLWAVEASVVVSRTISSLWRTFGKSSSARWLILPTGEFGPPDAELIGGVESKPHQVPSDLDHSYGDVVAQDDLLPGPPAENKHVTPP